MLIGYILSCHKFVQTFFFHEKRISLEQFTVTQKVKVIMFTSIPILMHYVLFYYVCFTFTQICKEQFFYALLLLQTKGEFERSIPLYTEPLKEGSLISKVHRIIRYWYICSNPQRHFYYQKISFFAIFVSFLQQHNNCVQSNIL